MNECPDEAGKEKEANGAVAREEAIHKDDHAKGGGSKEGRSEDEMLLKLNKLGKLIARFG
mgnify:CR=1